MTKRKKRQKASAAEKRAARKLISKAFKEIGAEARGKRERVSTRLRSAMSEVIQSELLGETGEPLTKSEARDLSKRLSLAGVAKKATARVRSYYVDEKGRFRDNRKATRGQFITQSSARRRDKLRAYWSTIRMIAKAQGVTIRESRKAYAITGSEPWEKLETYVEGRTT